MPFSADLQAAVNKYVTKHLPDDEFYEDNFDFMYDAELAGRVAAEFKAARYIYKLLEGLEAEGWLKRAQVKAQILSYASIYEAIIHHILFDILKSHPNVIDLQSKNTYKRISIPAQKMDALKSSLSHGGHDIVPMYETVAKKDLNNIRFDDKAACARDMGIISDGLCQDLVELYSARNAIHIHAEIRKEIGYEIELSRTAYRRMKVFREQVSAWLNENGYAK